MNYENHEAVVVIPARMASTRLPGKVLKDINGKPLIQHVYEKSMKCKEINNVIVLTPDEEILEVVDSFNGVAFKTGKYSTVLGRCAEGVRLLGQAGNHADIVVVQGDEPMITPEMIKLSLDGYRERAFYSFGKHEAPFGSCLYKKISREEAQNANTVKCIIGHSRVGPIFQYLSRSVIPGTTPEKDGKAITEFYKQVCIMTFKPSALVWYGNPVLSNIEKSEGIDLLRFVLNGISIIAIESFEDTQAVDTQADLEKVRELLKNEDTK